MSINQIIATELGIREQQVKAVLDLMEDGATIPFIARYRKEATNGLDDTQLRSLEQRYTYLSELEKRKQAILKSIAEQEKLTPELKEAINNTNDKTTLEDLYLPYKPKRRTKAQLAREAGLEKLAADLLENRELIPEEHANKFLNPEHNINDSSAALLGARHILIERWSEDASLIDYLRKLFANNSQITSSVQKNKEDEGAKFKDYFSFSESIKTIPSHRILALLRGRSQGILTLHIDFNDPEYYQQCLQQIAKRIGFIEQNKNADPWITTTIEWAWKIKIHLKFELEFFSTLKEKADSEAIKVFQENLKNLLMAAPAGKFIVIGLDPGFRSGVKCVVVDDTGKLLAHEVVYPHQPQNNWDKSINNLYNICKKHNVKLASIGNGTASRETERLIAELQKKHPELEIKKIVVSEAGASVYSASETAAKEFPNLDVSFRGAVSIARRLQDPLAELVKIEPKAIGVGQYQHDVNQLQLNKSLHETMEDCVNAVGADLNTASAPLLECISGLNKGIAQQIISYREQHGRFDNRKQLLQVPRLGEKAFQQCAGFVRIYDGSQALDKSAVHPERYSLVNKMLDATDCTIDKMIGNPEQINKINAVEYINNEIGLPTINDILKELNKPGRDPRPSFRAANFNDAIHSIEQLKPEMKLEGVITNVANFGAFVDIGVHQDGLVHISEIADHYVKDIQSQVKVGEIVQVKVLAVDVSRKRITLSMKTSPTTKNIASDNKQWQSLEKAAKNKNIAQHKKQNTSSSFASQLQTALKK